MCSPPSPAKPSSTSAQHIPPTHPFKPLLSVPSPVRLHGRGACVCGGALGRHGGERTKGMLAGDLRAPDMGHGFRGDQLGIGRLEMFLAGLSSDNSVFKKALHGAIHRLNMHFRSCKPAFTYYLPDAIPGMKKQWLEQVWRLTSTSGYNIQYDNMVFGEPTIIDHVHGNAQKQTAMEGCRATDVHYRRDLVQPDGCSHSSRKCGGMENGQSRTTNGLS